MTDSRTTGRIGSNRLRAAADADCAQLAALAASAHSHPWSAQQYRDSLIAGHSIWLLESPEGRVIACCVVSRLLDEAEILDVAVAPALRRQGIARALLAHVIGGLAEDIRRVLLEVRVSNQAARGLYGVLGFTEDGVRRNYYRTATGREDAILMSLVLPRPAPAGQ